MTATHHPLLPPFTGRAGVGLNPHHQIMTLIEQQIVGKKSPETCEDGIVVTNNHIAVIDGSTSKTSRRISPNISNGQFAAIQIQDVVSKMPADITLEAFCQLVTECMATAIMQSCDADKEMLSHHTGKDISFLSSEQRPAASAAIYSRYHQQVWLIGDCQCMTDGVLFDNDKPAEAVNAAKRSRFIQQLFRDRNENYTPESPLTQELQQHDIGRDYIIDDIINSMQGANRTYAVIDGTSIYIKGVKVIDVANTQELVLATDGYPFLKSTLKDSEEALATLLHNDPLCINDYQATKGLMKGYHNFDDRTYIRILLRS